MHFRKLAWKFVVICQSKFTFPLRLQSHCIKQAQCSSKMLAKILEPTRHPKGKTIDYNLIFRHFLINYSCTSYLSDARYRQTSVLRSSDTANQKSRRFQASKNQRSQGFVELSACKYLTGSETSNVNY